MWFTTDRGVIRYDGTHLKIFDKSDGLSSTVNFYFYKDNAKGFWLNDLGGRLNYWNGEGFETFKHKPNVDLKHSDHIMSMIIDITDSNLTVVEGNRRPYLSNYSTLKTINKTSGETTLSTYSSIGRIFSSNNPETDFYLAIKYGQNPNDHLPNCPLLDKDSYAFVDKNNNIWQPKVDGAYFWESDFPTQQPTVFFRGEHITSITEDKTGGYWFTSLTNGIHYMPSTSVKAYSNTNTSLESTIYGMACSDKYLYVSAYNGQFSVIDSLLNIKVYPCKNGQPPLYTASRKETHLRHYKYNETSDTYEKRAVHPLTNTEIYLEKHTLSLKLNSLSLNALHSTTNEEFDHIRSQRITSLEVGKDLSIFIGTRKNLIKTKIIEGHKLKPSKELLPFRINDLHLLSDSLGVLIATMNEGIYYANNDRTLFIENSILENITYQSIYLENDSILWIGSNVGLYKTHITLYPSFKINKIDKFTIQDGLISNNIKQILKWNSLIWLATDKGLCSFIPEKMKPNLSTPKIRIAQIKLNQDILSDSVTDITLEHTQNDIQVHYLGIEFDKPLYDRPFYRYRLNNNTNSKESDWIYTNSFVAYFSNLTSGGYTFLVQCRSENDIWSKPAEFRFTISKPYYKTNVFFILILALTLTLGILITTEIQKYKNKRLKEKIHLREAQLSVLTNQMNPHFIFNTLNSIQSYIITNKPEKASEYLSQLAKLMRKGLMFSKEQFISLEEEITFIENYISLQNNRLQNHINHTIHITGISDPKQLHIPSLITQPIVENAIIHAFDNSQLSPNISLFYHVHLKKQLVNVIIEDNGKGIRPHKKSKQQSYGMGIVKERLEILSKNTTLKKIDYYFDSQNLTKNSVYPGTKISIWMPIKNKSNSENKLYF